MPRVRIQDHSGRPVVNEFPISECQPITMYLPKVIIQYIDTTEGKGKRTNWIIQAMKEKMVREQNG